MRTKYFNNAGAGIMSETTLNTIVEHASMLYHSFGQSSEFVQATADANSPMCC